MTILVTALLASSLLTAAAEARGGGDVHGGGFGGGGVHVGGFGGAHIGGIGGDVHLGGIGVGHTDHFAPDPHEHAMHHLGRFGYGLYDPYCYLPNETPNLQPWPLYCR